VRLELCLIVSAAAVAACAPVTPGVRSGPSFREPVTGTLISREIVREWGAPGSNTLSPAVVLAPRDPNAADLDPLSPFDNSPVTFTVAGQHFTNGERVIVNVCLAPDHASIASADIFESSGDRRFDALALEWAHRVKLRDLAPGEQVSNCGAVRVEVHPAQEPRVFHSPGDSLT
jgi:hypothetical protein